MGAKPSRLTIRARLTLVYGGLFLLAGVVLLAVTYALVSARLPGSGGKAAVVGSSGSQTTGGQFSQQPQCAEDVSPPAAAAGTCVTHIVQAARSNALTALLTQGGIALGVVGLAAVAFGWLIAGRLLQPLHRVTETAQRIADAPAADRGLHERIALGGPHDEIKELADTFDLMLARLDHSFDGQRRFIGNASHELRTPLTLSRTLLEVTLEREQVSPEVHQLGTTLLEINARHQRLIDGLLLLARSERDVAERAFVDLADIVEHVVDHVVEHPATPAPRAKVDVRTEPAEAPTTGNPVLLERLVHNLVENGVRHNVPECGWVLVASGTAPDGAAVVQVSNTGPVVPWYEIPSLFEPFRRLNGDRIASPPGAGLGLSIVRAVARAHGGDARAAPREGGGLVVTVVLPGCPAIGRPPDHHWTDVGPAG